MLIALTQVNLRWKNYFAAHQARLAFCQLPLSKALRVPPHRLMSSPKPSLHSLVQSHRLQSAAHRSAVIIGELTQPCNVLDRYMRRVDNDANASQPREGSR